MQGGRTPARARSPFVVALTAGLAALGALGFQLDFASAETRVAPAQIAQVIEGKTLESSTLIGTSGQIFEPSEKGGWKRTGRGGVACRVSAAYQIGSHLWAVCSRAPLFKRAGTIWSAEPLTNRGRTRSSPISASPLISIGRHLYAVRKGAWARVSSAPSRITSLLASSSRSALAVSSRNQLLQLRGASWKVLIEAPKRRKKTDDLPRAVFGSAKNGYLIYASGALVHVGASRRKAVSLPSGLTAFSPGASCAEDKGEVLAIGRGTQKSGTVVISLLRFSGTKAVSAGPAPAFADDERIGILHCKGKRALLSTSKGRVLIRDEAGAWTEQPLVAKPPAEASKATPGSLPAKSR